MTDVVSARLRVALEGRYRMERELGAGGMATVYLAEDLKHDRKVALKVLKPELAAVVGAERFLAEIKTTANLRHPHILPLFDSGEADGLLWYAMPFVEGESLRDRLDRDHQLPVDEAVAIATKVLGALQAAHQAGVIHRDIKPANILLEKGEPVVSDFGIALALGAAGGGRLTETGLSVGTPYYMSPEQATGDQNVGPASDLYAVGCVLYEMLVGEPPYSGGSAQAVLGKIIAGDPVLPRARRATIPAHVDAAIRRALETVPADRFPTAGAFVQALSDEGFRYGATAEGEDRNTGVWKPLALAATAVAVASLGFAVLAGGGPEAGPRDVGLPFDAPMQVGQILPSMAVSPDGTFVIYEVARDGVAQLWVRSLESLEARPIPGTEGSFGNPIISPDGMRVAYYTRSELRMTRIDGEGSPSTIGQATSASGGRWRDDGVIVYADRDGRLIRWVDPETGPLREVEVDYCLDPTLRLGDTEVLCGGGAWKLAYSRSLQDPGELLFWTRSATTTQPGATVRGSQFRVVDDDWLVYMAIDGTLMAAPIEDPVARTVGRSVSFETNIRREAYTGAGQWDLTRDGTLVYGMGRNAEVGRLVEWRPDGPTRVLNASEAAHLRFEMSPDGTRMATVIEAVQGQELRVFDLRTGTWQVIDEGVYIGYAAWSPDGRNLVYTRTDADLGQGYVTVSRAADGLSSAVELLTGADEATYYQPSSYLAPDTLLVGVSGAGDAALLVDPTQEPAQTSELPVDPFFISLSPDRRWIAWSDQGQDRIVVQPWPALDRRHAVTNQGAEGRWLSDGRLVFYGTVGDPGAEATAQEGWSFQAVTMNPDGQGPPGPPEPLFYDPRWSDTPGWSHTPSPTGGLIYVQAPDETRIHYLRVIPGWVDQMKQAVAEANR